MNYKSSTDLKNIARDKMLGNYGTAIGAFLFIRSVILIGLIISSSVATKSPFMYLAMSFIFLLLEGVFEYGELTIYLKISVGMKAYAGDIFSAFKSSADRAIKARLIYVAILYGSIFVPNLFDYFLMGIVPGGKIISAVIWLMAAVLCIYLFLTYSQVMYYMQDFSDISVKEACRRSKELMKGNKFTLLYMCISFIPLYLVGILSMMLGLYFIHPYVKLTLTEFYLDRVRQGQSEEVKQQIDVLA